MRYELRPPSLGVPADQSKLFRLWLGVTEYLFRNPELLEEALDIAIDDNTFRSDDLEFTFAARVSLNQALISASSLGITN